MSCPICTPRTFGQLDEGYWSFDALYSIDQRKVRGSSLAPCETSLIHTPTVVTPKSPVAAGPAHLTLRAVRRLPSRPVGNLRDEALGQLRAQRVPLRPLRNDAARVRRASATAFGISGQGAEGGRRRSALAAPGRGRPRLLVRMCVRRPPGAWRRAAPRGRPSWLAGTRESVPSNPVAYSRPATPLF